ncbi:hypothetical protein HIM_06125 [Hirsutella minnesotensis 3608]|uniref:F-box domain-containing protein n=1 Tax=Hirsutella minnesotensis 3608 TaxID=1043627 RepID=A0A0F8A513_9HYPO|nr:hypothetical protein HIM_06125 [Hirsutella minnesotensis 3608]
MEEHGSALVFHDAAGGVHFHGSRPPILNLPLEVLIRITALLTTPELCAFRLTCRAVEELLYVTFTREFFYRKQFMIADISLQALIDISKSRLGPHLRQVHFGLDRFPEGIQRALPDESKERRFKQRYSDYFTLWNTGTHCAMLIEAFRNLANLEEIVFRDSNSTRRTRDGPGTEWTSYGSTTIFNETGVRLIQGPTGVFDTALPLQGCSQAFAVVLHALGAAGARPKGIQIIARNGNHLRDFAFNVPQAVEPSVFPVLERLERLHLSIDLMWRSSFSGWGPWGHAAAASLDRPQTETRLLRRFLSRTTNLKDLRINEHHDYNPSLTELLDWLAGTPPAPGDTVPDDLDRYWPPPVELPHLESLSLGIMNIGAKTVLQVVRKFAPRLQSLELWKITLQRCLPPNSDPGDPPRNSFWFDFMNQLRQVPDLNLRHFKAGMLRQAYMHRPKDYLVSFRKHGAEVQYTGPCWKDFVEEITPTLEVKWPRTITPEPGDSDSEDDSDGSMADMDDESEGAEDDEANE